MFVESLESEQMLEAILSTIDEAIHAVNADGVTIFYNKVAARHDGVEIHEVLGKHVLDVFPSLNKETSTLMKVIDSGEPIYEQSQTYTNIRGEFIDTVNTTLPIKSGSAIIGAVEIAKDLSTVRRLSQKLLDLQAKVERKKTKPATVNEAKYHWNDIITASESLNELKHHAKKAAETSSPVMVYGETGTGKELLVQSIHNASPRRKGAFIAQNCAALPSSLLESILFGTKKGSFTGSVDRPGLFELAHGGTLFLDEVNSMPLEIQAKLLRVLEDGVIRRVGATKSYAIDVRIIVAMNKDPVSCVKEQLLREDLYYRLNVFYLEIPPLRERKQDIPLLVTHFKQKYNFQMNKLIRHIEEPVIDLLLQQDWPGNVRELQHTMEYAMNMADGDTVGLQHLPLYLKGKTAETSEKGSSVRPLKKTLEETETGLIEQALEESGGNVQLAADLLDIPRQTLQYKIKKFGLA